jgi:oligoribonuclease NrnB/cAMP/cGMP phosphodiesterase (DHH superfamily)
LSYAIFHLSHTDLDGYGCQFITSKYFKNVKFYNSNYGKEIDERFAQILADIRSGGAERNVILITDLNLTPDQARAFEEQVRASSTKLLLLDHHQSGAQSCERHGWYYLDSSRCATKITYDFFSSIYGERPQLARFAEIVNAVDIWLDRDPNFELGKVCMSLVANSKELNRIMFDEANTELMFSMFEQATDYFDRPNAAIELDDNIHRLKKNFFRQGEDDTLGNLISRYNVMLLTRLKDKMTIAYKGLKGILTFNIGAVSVIGNDFLRQNPEYDFFMDVTSRKTVSFRSNGKADVSRIAAQLANGGGHVNASGGSLANFRDSFSYDIVKSQVMELIKSKEGLQ